MPNMQTATGGRSELTTGIPSGPLTRRVARFLRSSRSSSVAPTPGTGSTLTHQAALDSMVLFGKMEDV